MIQAHHMEGWGFGNPHHVWRETVLKYSNNQKNKWGSNHLDYKV